MVEYAWAPGAVNANTNVDLPAVAPKIRRLTRVEVSTMSDGTVAGATVTKAIVTGAPGAGQVALVDKDTVVFGDALTTRDVVRLTYEAIGEQVQVA